MHNLTMIIYRVVLVCLLFCGPVIAKATELPNSVDTLSQLSGQSRYDYESLRIINLIEKAQFTVITTDGQKHRGYVEVAADSLIVHKYEKRLSVKDRFLEDKAIPFSRIQNIEYNPPNKANLFKYLFLGLTAISAIGIFASL